MVVGAKVPKHVKGVLHNQIEIVTYTAVNKKGEVQEIAIVFRGAGGLRVFHDTFVPWDGGLLESTQEWGEGWVAHQGGDFTIRRGGGFPVKKFDVEKGREGGRGRM